MDASYHKNTYQAQHIACVLTTSTSMRCLLSMLCSGVIEVWMHHIIRTHIIWLAASWMHLFQALNIDKNSNKNTYQALNIDKNSKYSYKYSNMHVK